MANNAVRFVYLSAGHPLPIPSDPNAIYFVEEAKQLWVGDQLIADHIDPPDIPAYLEPYEVKRIVVSGEGPVVVDTTFDQDSGVITVTKGNPPAISISPTGLPEEVTPGHGVTVDVITGLSVEGQTIHPEKAKILFDDYMLVSGGHASDASVSLRQDPVEDMDAATKHYVDEKVKGLSGAMHFLGISSTKITDGGREHPKIDGVEVDTGELHAGDVVLYSPNHDNNYTEFVWKINSEGTGSWTSLGDEGSYVLKSTKVIAGPGLTGGGTLDSDVTISRELVPGGAKTYGGDTPTTAITSVERDEFGNLIDADVVDFKTTIDSAVDAATDGLENDIATAKTEAIASAKEYTDHEIRRITPGGTGIDVVILGTGNALVDAVFDELNQTLTITKGTIQGGEAPEWDVVDD